MSNGDATVPKSEGDEFLLLKDQKINDQDRREILEVIDRVAAENRLAVTPAVFALRPKKNGLIFPLVINAVAIAAVVGGFFLANLYFSKKQSDISNAAGTFFSAEGKLIEEVRKQSQAELHAKDQQIQSIQGQLSKLDQEATSLRQNMDSTIAAKEQDLKAQMQVQLDAEKARLAKLGVSQDEMNRRLAAFQDQMNAQFNQQLSDFQKSAQAQLAEKEQEIQKQQDAQRQILAQANSERQQIEASAQARESQMRTQFESQQAALQSQNAQLQSQATQAQAQLQSLAAQSQNEQLVADQIVGSYNSIVQDLKANQLDQAGKDMDALRALLSNPKIDSLPDIAKRRPVDLALLSAIQQLIATRARSTTTTAATVDPAVQQAANELASSQALVAQGDAAATRGDLKAAQDFYTRALAAVPSLNKAFTALEGNASDAAKQLLAQRDAAVADLQKEVAAKTQQLDALNRTLTTAQSTIAELRRQIAAQAQQIDAQTQQVARLNQNAAASNASVADLQKQISDQQQTAAALKAQLDSATGNVDDLKQQLASNASRLAELQKQLDAANVKLAYYKYGPDDLKSAEQSSRDQALNDILLVANYFTGGRQSPTVASKIDQISQSDPLFKDAATSIQSLAVNGGSGTPVLNTQFKLIGPVTFVNGNDVTVEKLVGLSLSTGASVMIRHKDSRGTEIPIAEGTVTTAASDHLLVTIKTQLQTNAQPQALDLAYLEVSSGN